MLSDTEIARLRRLLLDIRKETRGKCRGLFIDNKLDRIGLLIKKAERKSKKNYERVNKAEEQTHS